jgi:hypothetical protein
MLPPIKFNRKLVKANAGHNLFLGHLHAKVKAVINNIIAAAYQ